LIVSGSPVPAKSKKIARVGDTIMASSASTPEVPFWTNSHPDPETPVKMVGRSANKSREGLILRGEWWGGNYHKPLRARLEEHPEPSRRKKSPDIRSSSVVAEVGKRKRHNL
jgi:hypothetical protein